MNSGLYANFLDWGFAESVEALGGSAFEPKQMIRSSSTRVITSDTTHLAIEPSQVIEYEWPFKSGERYFIQVCFIIINYEKSYIIAFF